MNIHLPMSSPHWFLFTVPLSHPHWTLLLSLVTLTGLPSSPGPSLPSAFCLTFTVPLFSALDLAFPPHPFYSLVTSQVCLPVLDLLSPSFLCLSFTVALFPALDLAHSFTLLVTSQDCLPDLDLRHPLPLDYLSQRCLSTLDPCPLTSLGTSSLPTLPTLPTLY